MIFGLLLGCGTAPATTPTVDQTPPAVDSAHGQLSFRILSGPNADRSGDANYFYRRDHIAAHLLLRSGPEPRVIAALPAGDAGVGMWFDKPAAPVYLALEDELEPVDRPDGMRGVGGVVTVSGSLMTRGVVLSSVRVLRDYANDAASLPAEIRHQIDADGGAQVVHRTTVDGQHHLELRVEGLDGAVVGRVGDQLQLSAGRYRFEFLQDDPPLEPLPLEEILGEKVVDDPVAQHVLAFLTYRNVWLAGSWRFLTYFGRDTLMSVRLLMPALKPAAVEAALGSVLDRLSDDGQVAHEEEIGEFAALRHTREGRAPTRQPIYDYKMVDDNFMLAPVLAHYVFEAGGRDRMAGFLARKTPGGRSYHDALAANLAFVVAQAAPYAADPTWHNLIALHDDQKVGDWRDSDDGLGGGRYSYSVNASLVPAALEAAARLWETGVMGDPGGQAEAARKAAAVWDGAREHFRVEVDRDEIPAAVRRYAQQVPAVEAMPASAAGPAADAFYGLSIDERGQPIPVMHSDVGFRLLFNRPGSDELALLTWPVAVDFPEGLASPLGILIANPLLVDDAGLRQRFGPDRYHGSVVWPWQHALLLAGIERQLARFDLAGRDTGLRAVRQRVQHAAFSGRGSEVAENWSWTVDDEGNWQPVPLGGFVADDEANAAQLWSTVFLAFPRPSIP